MDRTPGARPYPSPADGQSLRVAIAGCHRMLSRQPAAHNFAADLAAVPETSVVAVFDAGAETRSDFLACWQGVWGDIASYDDFGRMVRDQEPDIVCIATRQTLHARQFELAIAAGVRGLLCDKPLATSLSEADQMLAACRAAGVPLAFGLQRRWSPRYRHLRKLICSGTIGVVTGASGWGMPNAIHHGPHWYDTVLLLIGDPEPVWVSGLVDDTSSEPPDARQRLDPPARGQVGLATGSVAYVTSVGGPGVGFDVLGDKGRLVVIDDARTAYLWQIGAARTWGDPQPVEFPTPLSSTSGGEAMVRDLVRAVHDGGATTCDAAEARRATEIGFALHASSALGGVRIDLPLQDRSRQITSLPWGNE